MFTRNSAEAVAARANRVALEVDLDVVPMGKGLRDLTLRRLVGRSQVLQRCIGKDDAPAEGIERPIALVEVHGPRGKARFDQYPEIEAGGSAADTRHAHPLTL